MVKDELIEKINRYIDINKETKLKDLDLNNTKVRFLAQGEYNINFVLDVPHSKYVFRVNTGSQLQIENQIRYEYNAIKYLEKSGVTPKVYFVDDSLSYFDYGILIMEFLEGVPLNYNKDLSKAANIFSKIHSLEIDESNHFILEKRIFSDRINEGERLLEDIWHNPLIDKNVKGFFYKFLDFAKDNRNKENYFIEDPWHVINNTEVNSHNFIIGRKKSYLIDWEKPVISDPSQDLTQFIAPTTTLWKTDYILSKQDKNDFFKVYIEGLNGKNKDIQERVHMYTPYLYLRALAWSAHAYIEYHNPNKKIKNMDTFAKVKEYLQIDFMEDLLRDYF